jgi:hypothetical protein
LVLRLSWAQVKKENLEEEKQLFFYRKACPSSFRKLQTLGVK